jgi:DNA-binding IscR family transcriptional regulator
MWRKAHEALSQVYDNTTFKELVEQARDRAGGYTPSYAI